jgi:REP element-mobilizing transposase RayT
LGVIEDGEMKLNKVGEIIKKVWLSLPNRFHDVKLDEFVIMPNHFHGIIIVGATLMIAQNDRAGTSPAPTIIRKENVGATLVVAQNNNVITPDNRVGTRPTPTLGDVVGVFKSLCVNSLINQKIFIRKLWQRNYFEHIVRNETELNNIRQYILNNSGNWEEDIENLESKKKMSYEKYLNLILEKE